MPVEERTVTIPACDEHEGFYSLTTTLPWVCMYCGERRGEPYNSISFDGRMRLAVSCWKNPCGHVERYSTVRDWIKNNQRKEGANNDNTTSP